MKNKIVSLALGFVMIAVVACGENKDQQSTEENAVTVPANTVSTTLPGKDSTLVNAVNTTVPISTQPVTSAALNPAHGLPGHRCDIAVGAPLNSPPNSTPNISTTIPGNQSQGTPINTNGTVMLNPPHGQPGHDCAVEVGKPLKKS
jgi:hypothetical protein